MCGSIIFENSENYKTKGLHELTIAAIQKCLPTYQPYLYKNILIAGGNCRIKGFGSKLQSEITNTLAFNAITSKSYVNVTTSRYANSAWKGGAVASSNIHWVRSFISNDEYHDIGANIVSRKCW